MKPLDFALRLFVNLFAVFVVVAMFRIATTPFESVVISGLALIYVRVTSWFAAQGFRHEVIAAQFLAVRRLLRDTQVAEHEAQLRAEYREAHDRDMVELTVNQTTNWIIMAVAVWHLVKAVF